MECLLVDLFHWSLNDIDQTDIESLIPFFFRFASWKEGRAGKTPKRRVTIDKVDFL